MPARADSSDQSPTQIVRRIYDGSFIEGLSQRFKFDGNSPDIVKALLHMGVSYIVHRRLENTTSAAQSRRSAATLKRAINTFRKAIKKGEDLALPELMAIGALYANDPVLDIYDLEIEGKDDAYFYGLLRLLDFLEKGLDEEIRHSTGKPGPRANLGLQTMAIHAGQFFAVQLNGRPFTIDQHKPFKATQAFDFVKALVDPLDDVTQDDIITAIRSAKSRLIKIKN